ncbi:phytoene desaturase family protein [Bacillus sp. KH172YL63]|uniref:phytoene desaturase family protein n=1 Tax=Bacillus sp. KH172YL63 TaxID=2709784 RepID=UPI0013E496D8|nr:phytoene desaturase family protein [Bacillus sp. KH172YL63]BCB04383.1 dehydrosqualene desaturase [Bacillus sp. KH172YL63]
MKNIIIIGCGLGGLSAGISLQSKGYNVTIIDENEHPGGKMMPVEMDGYRFDFGPNTITMPHVFTSVINDAGGDATRYFEFVKLVTHTKNIFRNGQVLYQSADREIMASFLEKLDPFAAGRYEDYLLEVEKLYELAERGFFHRVFASWRDYLAPGLLNSFLKVRPFEKMDHFHRRFFRDEDVLKVFNRYATYIGSSPYECPATFSLIGHLEMNEGVYYTKGGNPAIANGFLRFFKEQGGQVLFGKRVKEIVIKDKRALGVVTEDGERFQGHDVIVNGDFITATKQLIREVNRPSHPDQKLDGYEPSISAFVILAGLRTFQEDVHHHQVYFSGDYQKEFSDIFNGQSLPEDPTIYISHSAASDRSISKGSNLFILVNAPAIELSEEEVRHYKEKIYSILERRGLAVRQSLEVERVYTPSTIKRKFSAYKGSLYGLASHRMSEAFLRPSNVSRDIGHLFYVGGTTHPGGGSPMVTLSGQNVAGYILKRDARMTE